ncbi:tetratricopeptide repeat protein 36 [Loxodonta africana]|uniref:tetratricopeptide repeat protein 36 n=1 Tax=Loxodonta africana TaxID=9785 RepID=UPI0030D6080E
MGTPNDQAVLQAIFNPDAPFGDVAGLDLGEEAEKEADEDGIFSGEQLTQSKALELQGVMAAEAGDLNTALERFGQAICLLPERASPYNNRAQARRLQGDVAGALEDLERALALSGGRGRAARQSFVQRGLLARLQGRDDDARRDLERAARLGSPFARRQLVLLNPYAALCNRMLADVMGRLRGTRDGRLCLSLRLAPARASQVESLHVPRPGRGAGGERASSACPGGGAHRARGSGIDWPCLAQPEPPQQTAGPVRPEQLLGLRSGSEPGEPLRAPGGGAGPQLLRGPLSPLPSSSTQAH